MDPRPIEETWGVCRTGKYPTVKGYTGEQLSPPLHFDTMFTAAISRETGVFISHLLEVRLEVAVEYKEKVAKPPVRFSDEQLDKMRFDAKGEFKSWLGDVDSQIHSLITERVVNSIGPALDR